MANDPNSPQYSEFIDINLSVPTVARIYDWLLNGKDNFVADREAGHEFLRIAPELRQIALDNRAWLSRVVTRMAADCGVDQFLDVGSGLPTVDNTHQVAQRVLPGARVIYVDNDPVVLTHGRAILDDNLNTTVITADVREPKSILEHPDTQALLDFSRPVGVLLIALTHCLKDDDHPAVMYEQLLDAMPSGSYVAYSHIVCADEAVGQRLTDSVLEATHGSWGRVRTPEEAVSIVDRLGLHVLEPGYVDIRGWPEREPPEAATGVWEIGGLARKP
ncbi:SAM-dependent methyltransferase [Lipingzhangella sp. LS1_29]|uniref:SAM-dependent methyltransferase n=1 Tax=Lipingzhangella rawalii TaxID=2055835 RepID=A0ABU2H791_9ACTN|nr:SAM-dependent methyltransferase [Lipingzhangella rawalii]MDS1271158.1 SAM-dependent methyltransferase [Lipingzhangella rawalii]